MIYPKMSTLFVPVETKLYYNRGVEPKSFREAREIFLQHNGLLRTTEALSLGIAPATLYRMRDGGRLHQESRGLYRLLEQEMNSAPELIKVSRLVTRGVICLTSALVFHKLTIYRPDAIYVALPRGSRQPKIEDLKLDVIRVSGDSYRRGIVQYKIDGIPVPIYDPAKTIADCFKFRSKVGIEVALSALKTYIKRPGAQVGDLREYARVNRGEAILQPYLEAIL
jgi:predicted transcriptional regulator of viral defense system